MAVIKRTKNSTREDLIKAIQAFVLLLKDQDETEAIEALEAASKSLTDAQPSSKEFRESILAILDAFEGDHELISYTFIRESDEWTEADQLSQASSRVLSLARRLKLSS